MTKPREETSIEAAVLAVIHHLGIDDVARLVDRGPGTIRHWTDPDHDGRPTMQQCILMDQACVERGIKPPLLTAYLAQIGKGKYFAKPVIVPTTVRQQKVQIYAPATITQPEAYRMFQQKDDGAVKVVFRT